MKLLIVAVAAGWRALDTQRVDAASVLLSDVPIPRFFHGDLGDDIKNAFLEIFHGFALLAGVVGEFQQGKHGAQQPSKINCRLISHEGRSLI